MLALSWNRIEVINTIRQAILVLNRGEIVMIAFVIIYVGLIIGMFASGHSAGGGLLIAIAIGVLASKKKL